MALYPDLLYGVDIHGCSVDPQFKTLKLGPTDGDFIQRRKKRTLPLYVINLRYQCLLESEMQQIYEFYLARAGSWEAFSVFDIRSFPYTDLPIGTGDGINNNFDLTAKGCTNIIIKVGAVTKTAGVDYDVSAGLGVDGCDRVVFRAGHTPAAGAAVTASLRGRRYFTNCIFRDDSLSRAAFEALCYTSGVVISQVSS